MDPPQGAAVVRANEAAATAPLPKAQAKLISADQPPPAGAIIASPDGAKTARGTLSKPLDLATAVSSSSPVEPGGMVLLRGGVYAGTFTSDVSGEQDRPIVVRSYPGEWAVIDGGTRAGSVLKVQGSDVWFKDFEVMRSDPSRRSAYPGNTPPDISRSRYAGIDVLGARTRLIDLLVHDNGDGIGLWKSSGDSVAYGCVIFNNGWVGTDHSWGHGIYVQNEIGTKYLADNVLLNNFGMGIHAYALRGPVVGIDVTGTTSFENGAPAGTRESNILVGAEVGDTDRIDVDNSVFYHRAGVSGINAYMGYPEQPRTMGQRGAFSLTDSAVVGGSRPLIASSFSSAYVQRNLIFGRPKLSGDASWLVEWTPKEPAILAKSRDYAWDRNVYRTTSGQSDGRVFRFIADGDDQALSFEQWRSTTAFDGSTNFLVARPEGVRISVRPNRYEPGRAFVTVVNWSGKVNATIDLSGIGLERGEGFEIRDVQDLGADPVFSGVYRGEPVTISLVSRSVMTPVGLPASSLEHTSPEFGSFLVLPKEQSRVLSGVRRPQ